MLSLRKSKIFSELRCFWWPYVRAGLHHKDLFCTLIQAMWQWDQLFVWVGVLVWTVVTRKPTQSKNLFCPLILFLSSMKPQRPFWMRLTFEGNIFKPIVVFRTRKLILASHQNAVFSWKTKKKQMWWATHIPKNVSVESKLRFISSSFLIVACLIEATRLFHQPRGEQSVCLGVREVRLYLKSQL